ncbi:mannitol dehydrogenase family protein [Corynebacterium accolens]|uniref:mannitol dehydrogenase family protein n=1 Tax=Corynebacterium accolens TaxID=38284 RepID=UPI002542D2D0|nr:mannitol dehydrogenase family protein [Corynebacterium accolens]MDK4266285.1 mannitol dehydrogenase family protein [Corynebacterium accolens]MDK4308134.1 mannitol dehydrogenase family protein [Corynebacterium accolens]MDK4323036.1 mannitol dehydrogenase family protein [Corynebacterium accolens]
MHLSTNNLNALSAQVKVPDYDRSEVTPGIVHFGVGGFHRAHQALYLDKLMSQGKAMDFGIIGMGVMLSDARMRDALHSQDCLYTLTEKSPDGTEETRVVGSIIDYVYSPDDPAAAVKLLADPQIRIVSLTVTEGGYNFDHVKGEFDLKNEHVAADISDLRNEDFSQLRTFYGLVTAALISRWRQETAPFTVMSCDNIQGNGEMVHRMFKAFAGAVDSELAEWIEGHVSFPNSMVDRITPETTDADRADISEKFGYVDEWPVVCENFTQWVLEENFVNDRPPYEDVGVEVVDDVVPYELMKLRLLNASHQGLCYFGYLAGHRLVHDVMADHRFQDFLLAYMEREGTPSLQPLPGVDLDAYRKELIDRFGNSAVKDTVARLCAESSDRIPKWLLPVVRENLATGNAPVTLSAAIVASWARYAEGIDESGDVITIVDPLADRLQRNAQSNRTDSLAFLRDREIFGDLCENSIFTAEYARVLESLHAQGSIATLDMLLSELD